MAITADALVSAFEMTPQTRILQVFPHFFDGGIAELSMAWGAGGALCLPEGNQPLVGGYLLETFRRFEITDAILLPSVMALLPEEPVPQLRCLISVAESLPQTVAQSWSQGRRFYNAYGPGEAAICATTALYTEWLAVTSEPPIGRPIAGKQVYLLDANMQLLPCGVAGEIYLGGMGLARGYVNRAALTAERFLPNPFAVSPGERLYRSGDMGYYLEDGQVFFSGRRDMQVKLNGFRIELEEIETHLAAHSGLAAAAAGIREVNGERVIVAYVIPSQELAQTLGDEDQEGMELGAAVRQFLRKRLPHYMQPRCLVFLESFPTHPNGKINRQALPAPEQDFDIAKAVSSPAATARERELAEIFCEVLGMAQLDIHANFFDMGANSLNLLRIYGRLQPRYEQVLSLLDFYTEATLAKLAALLDEKTTQGASDKEILVSGGDGSLAASRTAVVKKRAEERISRRNVVAQFRKGAGKPKG